LDDQIVRVFEAHVTWIDVTEQYSNPENVARARERLAWAGTNTFRRALLEEPQFAEFVMRHQRLDQAIDGASAFLRRLRRAG
jgi:hypothetical protein